MKSLVVWVAVWEIDMADINFMQVVGCSYCGNSIIGFGNASVNIEMSKTTYCEGCRQTHTEKKTRFFCSLECFNNCIASGYELQWEDE